ncbi:MAG: glycine cleavage system protein GcvH [Candidatus Cloacimonetes bacterium]|nr:glycine cleavage system protein GcvH [Candidatus Cloacimonadota bacterium]
MVVKGLYYTETHEWIKVEGDDAFYGITDHAQHELGDIVYVELPEEDEELEAGDAFGSIEAVKAVEDLISPVTGVVIEVNEDLEDAPETINKSAFEDGWIIKIKLTNKSELKNLLSADEYKKLIEE